MFRLDYNNKFKQFVVMGMRIGNFLKFWGLLIKILDFHRYDSISNQRRFIIKLKHQLIKILDFYYNFFVYNYFWYIIKMKNK